MKPLFLKVKTKQWSKDIVKETNTLLEDPRKLFVQNKKRSDKHVQTRHAQTQHMAERPNKKLIKRSSMELQSRPPTEATPRNRTLSPLKKSLGRIETNKQNPHVKNIQEMNKMFAPITWQSKNVSKNNSMANLEEIIKINIDLSKAHDIFVSALNCRKQLKEELDLNHRVAITKQDQERVTTSYVNKRGDAEGNIDNPTGNTAIPYGKRVPPSMYNSSKNAQSFEHNITKVELERRIEKLIEFTGILMPNKQKAIGDSVMKSFKSLSESEIKEFYATWTSLLDAFHLMLVSIHEYEQEYDSSKLSQTEEVNTALMELQTVIQDQLMQTKDERSDVSDSDTFDAVKKLSKIFRASMKQVVDVVDPNTVMILEGSWKSFVHILDTSILSHDSQIMYAVRAATERTEADCADKLNQTQKKLDEWQSKLEAQNKEVDRLQKGIERLRDDKLQFESIIIDREAEIRRLSEPPDLSDIHDIMMELGNFLDDTEQRQADQANMLNEIGTLINHDWKPKTPPPEKVETPKPESQQSSRDDSRAGRKGKPVRDAHSQRKIKELQAEIESLLDENEDLNRKLFQAREGLKKKRTILPQAHLMKQEENMAPVMSGEVAERRPADEVATKYDPNKPARIYIQRTMQFHVETKNRIESKQGTMQMSADAEAKLKAMLDANANAATAALDNQAQAQLNQIQNARAIAAKEHAARQPKSSPRSGSPPKAKAGKKAANKYAMSGPKVPELQEASGEQIDIPGNQMMQPGMQMQPGMMQPGMIQPGEQMLQPGMMMQPGEQMMQPGMQMMQPGVQAFQQQGVPGMIQPEAGLQQSTQQSGMTSSISPQQFSGSTPGMPSMISPPSAVSPGMPQALSPGVPSTIPSGVQSFASPGATPDAFAAPQHIDPTESHPNMNFQTGQSYNFDASQSANFDSTMEHPSPFVPQPYSGEASLEQIASNDPAAYQRYVTQMQINQGNVVSQMPPHEDPGFVSFQDLHAAVPPPDSLGPFTGEEETPGGDIISQKSSSKKTTSPPKKRMNTKQATNTKSSPNQKPMQKNMPKSSPQKSSPNTKPQAKNLAPKPSAREPQRQATAQERAQERQASTKGTARPIATAEPDYEQEQQDLPYDEYGMTSFGDLNDAHFEEAVTRNINQTPSDVPQSRESEIQTHGMSIDQEIDATGSVHSTTFSEPEEAFEVNPSVDELGVPIPKLMRAMKVQTEISMKNAGNLNAMVNQLGDQSHSFELTSINMMRRDLAQNRPPSNPNLVNEQLAQMQGDQPPMTKPHIYKMFENVMDEKWKSDISDSQSGKIPRAMPEFMLDFLFMKYGLKTLALKQLSSLVSGLEKLVLQDEEYAQVFCKLINVLTNKPIDSYTCLFLTKARAGFVEIQNRFVKQFAAKLSWDQGGEAPLTEVAELISKLFRKYRTCGESILEKLEPACYKTVNNDRDAYILRIEKTLMLLCSKIAKTGRDLKFVLNSLDPENKGSMLFSDFIRGIRKLFDVWISETECFELCQFLDKEGSGRITAATLNRINFKECTQRAYASDMLVTKCDFLTLIISETERKRELDKIKLSQLFSQYSSEGSVMEYHKFTELVQSLDNQITDMQALHLFREALENSGSDPESDDMSAEAFSRVCFEHNLGGFGKELFGKVKAKGDLTTRIVTPSHVIELTKPMTFTQRRDFTGTSSPPSRFYTRAMK